MLLLDADWARKGKEEEKKEILNVNNLGVEREGEGEKKAKVKVSVT